jgi:hypothetical protein
MWTSCVAKGVYADAYRGWRSPLGLADPSGEMELGMMLCGSLAFGHCVTYEG